VPDKSEVHGPLYRAVTPQYMTCFMSPHVFGQLVDPCHIYSSVFKRKWGN